MYPSRFDSLPASPFARLARLLDGLAPGAVPVDMAVGEPKHPVPGFVAPVLAAQTAAFGRYPPGSGSPGYRAAVADWLTRRYRLRAAPDPERHVLAVAGSREALFLIALVAVPENAAAAGQTRPAVLIPNPFYQAYAAAAVAAGAEPVYLEAPAENGFLPDFSAVPGETLARTALAYICSPSNPQGAVADADYLESLVKLARRHGFLVVSDECYSEIYPQTPPPGALAAADALGEGFSNVIVFNSLSKRSGLPGLRCGFCAGDGEVISAFARLRNVAGPQVPLPVQAAGEAAWRDEAHVEESRSLYRRKMQAAAEILGSRFGGHSPQGGFFLWLDVAEAGGGEAAARTLWSRAGLRVLPGAYLAREDAAGRNPARDFIRVALVHDLETTNGALMGLAGAL